MNLGKTSPRGAVGQASQVLTCIAEGHIKRSGTSRATHPVTPCVTSEAAPFVWPGALRRRRARFVYAEWRPLVLLGQDEARRTKVSWLRAVGNGYAPRKRGLDYHLLVLFGLTESI